MNDKTNFRALVVRAIAFLMPLFLVLVLLSVLFVPKNNSEYAGMEQVSANGILAEPKDSIDVVIIGDSESLSAYSPMQMWEEHGFTSYVCGTHAQSTMHSYDFLEKVLRNQSPKLIVMEANAFFRSLFPHQILFNNVAKRMPVFRYHDRWKTMNPEDFGTLPHYTKLVRDKGFIIRRKRKAVDQTLQDNFMVYDTEKLRIRPAARWYLNQFVRLCRKRGVKMMLVSTPSVRNWTYKRHNCVQDFADQNDIFYLDINLHTDEIDFNWKKDSMDGGDHLNLTGAKKCTAYFGAWLKEHEDLPDRREDADFQSWNENLKEYHKALKKGRDRADYDLIHPLKDMAALIVKRRSA